MAILVDRSSAKAYARRGIAAKELKKPLEAVIADLLKALELDPTLADVAALLDDLQLKENSDKVSLEDGKRQQEKEAAEDARQAAEMAAMAVERGTRAKQAAQQGFQLGIQALAYKAKHTRQSIQG